MHLLWRQYIPLALGIAGEQSQNQALTNASIAKFIVLLAGQSLTHINQAV